MLYLSKNIKELYYSSIKIKQAYYGSLLVYKIADQTTTEDPEIPSGVKVITANGTVKTASSWTTSDGITGISVSDGTHKLIMAIDGYGSSLNTSSSKDDGSLNSRKAWSSCLSFNIADILTTTLESSAIKDYLSKENTDAILTALSTASNPSETNNAAVICRNYSAGIYGAGEWDLPAAGHLQLIVNNLSDILETLETLDDSGYSCSALILILNSDIGGWGVWSSTEYGSYNVWDYNFYDNAWETVGKSSSNFVIPIRTIA